MNTQLQLFSGLDLPPRVRVISLWEPYATLVVDGVKTIETRTWNWPYEPSWLVIHAARHFAKDVGKRLGITLKQCSPGKELIGMVWVKGSRPLLPEDEKAACFYEPGRFAWLLEASRRFTKPIPFRGPQKFASVERDVVINVLGCAA